MRCGADRDTAPEIIEIEEASISDISAFLEQALVRSAPRIRFTWRGRLYDLDRTCAVAFLMGVDAAHDALDAEIEAVASQRSSYLDPKS